MGLLILICTFASGKASGAEPKTALPGKRQAFSFAVTAAVILSCGAYSEMAKRFIHDPLDGQRVEKRESFVSEYSEFISAVEAIPLDSEPRRVLLAVYQQETNPIVINEASPVSFRFADLSGDAVYDMELLRQAMEIGHERYLYIAGCSDELVELLSGCTEDGEFKRGVLYEITEYEQLRLSYMGAD